MIGGHRQQYFDNFVSAVWNAPMMREALSVKRSSACTCLPSIREMCQIRRTAEERRRLWNWLSSADKLGRPAAQCAELRAAREQRMRPSLCIASACIVTAGDQDTHRLILNTSVYCVCEGPWPTYKLSFLFEIAKYVYAIKTYKTQIILQRT